MPTRFLHSTHDNRWWRRRFAGQVPARHGPALAAVASLGLLALACAVSTPALLSTVTPTAGTPSGSTEGAKPSRTQAPHIDGTATFVARVTHIGETVAARPATSTATFTPIPTAAPTEFPYSSLPGWIAYIDFECSGLCTNLAIIRPDLTARTLVTHHDSGLAADLLWAPNGRSIIYQIFVTGGDGGLQIRMVNLANQATTILTPKFVQEISGWSWSPDSRYVVVGYMNSDGKSGRIQRLDVAARQITNLSADLKLRDVSPDWSPDGKTIVFSGHPAADENSPYSLWTMTAGGAHLTEITPATDLPADFLLPRWSPNGAQIAFLRRTPQNVTQLWTMNTDGTQQLKLAEVQGAPVAEAPVWSRDGLQIGFIAGTDSATHVILANANGHGAGEINSDPGDFTGLSWSPDSRALIFMEDLGIFTRRIHLFVQDLDIFEVSADTDMLGAYWSPISDIPIAP